MRELINRVLPKRVSGRLHPLARTSLFRYRPLAWADIDMNARMRRGRRLEVCNLARHCHLGRTGGGYPVHPGHTRQTFTDPS
jgi:hypothetical protein